MSRPAERPLRRWYLITLGVILGIGLAVMVVVAIVSPTQEVLTGLATVLIPAILAAGEAGRRYLKRRRRR